MSVLKDIDIICVGEAIVDFLGHEHDHTLLETSDYKRYLGGSPTNVAMNCARLGLKVHLAVSVGDDDFGTFMTEGLEENNINIDTVQRVKGVPTSVIFISRTDKTPHFLPYRTADCHVTEDQIPDEVLKRTKIYHTTCFALSRDIARTTILNKAKIAFENGSKISIDLNYSPVVWPDREEALEVIKKYCKLNPFVKISVDDMRRLFGDIEVSDMFTFFHKEGVDIVCLTQGSEGVILSKRGQQIINLPAVKIEKILDATGAGDAFWAGFLYSYLKEYSLEESLDMALKLAALKLQNAGHLPENSIELLAYFRKKSK